MLCTLSDKQLTEKSEWYFSPKDGPLHMDKQRQDDQLEPTYSSHVPIRDVAFEDLPEAMNDREKW